MICTSVIPCLSSGLAKNDKVFVLFPGFLAILKVWRFFQKYGTNLTPKQSNMKGSGQDARVANPLEITIKLIFSFESYFSRVDK